MVKVKPSLHGTISPCSSTQLSLAYRSCKELEYGSWYRFVDVLSRTIFPGFVADAQKPDYALYAKSVAVQNHTLLVVT
jgi:hypothetical protein